jgi:hypothetical protein
MKAPKVLFNPSEPLQDFYSDGSGDRWSVARLIEYAKDIKPFDMPVAGLDLSAEIWRGCDMYSLAWHCKKVMDADLSKPILISWDGCIADGRHRILKALIKGKRYIPAKRIMWKPTPCSTGNPV